MQAIQLTKEQRGASIRNAFLAGKQSFRKRNKSYGDVAQQFTFICIKYQPSTVHRDRIWNAVLRTLKARGLRKEEAV